MNPIGRDDAVETVRSRTDIVELVGRYLKLKKSGSRYVGLCPFHAEKTPSFSVNAQRGFFYCFGCKASGDVFSFLMRMEGKTFPEALEDLANRAGVELPARRRVDPRVREKKQRLLDVLAQAREYYQEQLWHRPAGETARNYLTERGIDEALARRYGLGAAPAGWQNLRDQLQAKGTSLDDGLEVGLLIQGKRGPYDMFRNRLTFPIVDLDGQTHGFGARKLDPEDHGGKYINSPQGPVFDKSNILYGLHEARRAIQQKGRAILVEGYFDVLSLVAGGVEEAVATCGTSLTDGHAHMLKRFSDRVVTLFDGDAAGLKASFRSAAILLAEDISPYMVALPAGEDPDSYIRRIGRDAFEALVAEARPSVEVLADALAREAGTDVEAKTRATRRLIPLLAACTDRVRQSGYVRLVAERFQIDEAALRQALARGSSARPDRSRPVREPKAQAVPSTADAGPPPNEDELTLMALLVRSPALIPEALGAGAEANVRSPITRDLLSRLRETETPTESTALLNLIEDQAVKDRLAAELVQGEEMTEEQAREDLDSRLRKLRLVTLKEEERRLQALIDQANRAGLEEESRSLQKTKLTVARELQALGLAVKRLK